MAVDKPPIRGIVIGHKHSETAALIIEATADEVATFGRGDHVAFAKQSDGVPEIGPDMLLYDSQGRPVAMVTQFDVIRDMVDVTSRSSNWQQFTPGLQRVKLKVEVVGQVKFRR